MEDKRTIANQELQNELDGSFRFYAPPEQENFVELPVQEKIEESKPETVNNFNVSVSVNGKTEPKTTVVNQAVQNALPNTTELPEDVKKNSPVISSENSNEEKYVEQLRGIVGEDAGMIEQHNDVVGSIDSIPVLDMTQLTQFETPEYGEYTYSVSDMKQNNPSVKRDYEVLQNIISHSISSQEPMVVSPDSAIDASLVIDQINENRQYYQIENLEVQNNVNNNLEMANQKVRSQQSNQPQSAHELERQLQNIKTSSLQEIEEADNIEARSQSRPDGAGAPPRSAQKNPQTSKNIKSSSSSIDKFINKMNSPPVWRAVLG
jgi:hypothetical protein